MTPDYIILNSNTNMKYFNRQIAHQNNKLDGLYFSMTTDTYQSHIMPTQRIEQIPPFCR